MPREGRASGAWGLRSGRIGVRGVSGLSGSGDRQGTRYIEVGRDSMS